MAFNSLWADTFQIGHARGWLSGPYSAHIVTLYHPLFAWLVCKPRYISTTGNALGAWIMSYCRPVILLIYISFTRLRCAVGRNLQHDQLAGKVAPQQNWANYSAQVHVHRAAALGVTLRSPVGLIPVPSVPR